MNAGIIATRVVRTALVASLAAGVVAVSSARLTARPQAPAAEPDVIFVPTPQPIVEAMLDMAQVTSADVVYDLGSGDGRVVITAAKKYGARGVGIEIDPALVRQSRAAAVAAGVADRVTFIEGNIFTADIHEATVVTLYLLQSLNERLRPKFVRELRPGTRLVSHVFNMGPEWPPVKATRIDGHPVALWVVE